MQVLVKNSLIAFSRPLIKRGSPWCHSKQVIVLCGFTGLKLGKLCQYGIEVVIGLLGLDERGIELKLKFAEFLG